jgi:hypothetical protein
MRAAAIGYHLHAIKAHVRVGAVGSKEFFLLFVSIIKKEKKPLRAKIYIHMSRHQCMCLV